MPAKLSTHVLDTTHGCLASGLKIELWLLDGRTETPPLTADEMRAGQYEILFFFADYFAAKTANLPKLRFLDKVPVRFGIADAGVGYHVSLLCSPWSDSTYRGR